MVDSDEDQDLLYFVNKENNENIAEEARKPSISISLNIMKEKIFALQGSFKEVIIKVCIDLLDK